MRAGAFRAVGALLLFAVLALLARLWSLQMPLSEDAGAYLYVADTIRDGGLPYVDAADNKGPLTYLLFGALDLVTGGSTTGLRLTLVLACALTALAVAARVRRAAGDWAGLAAGVAMALIGSTPFLEGDDLNTEQYGVLPLATAWWLAARGDVRSAAAAGAALSAAVLMHVGFAALAPVIALELWFAADTERARRFAAAAAGALAVAAIPLAWLLLSGALDDMWDLVVGKVGNAVGGNVKGTGLDDLPLFDIPTRIPFLIGAAGAALALTRPALRLAAGTALLWILICWLRVKLARYEFAHHYYLAVPGVAAGMALGGAALWAPLAARPRLRVAAFGAAAVMVALLVWRYIAEPARDQFRKPTTERVRFPQYSLAYVVGDELRARTSSDDTVAVSGNNPTVYWRANRRAPNRFFAEYSLVPEYVIARRRALRERPPDAIVLMPGYSQFGYELRDLARSGGYRRAWTGDGASIWLRG
ncbi:MAG: hypothetical protein QOE69_2565 [Thermoleophilaceae bacterium]|nr:hypothetical protein [Thermoleophilaceae bacterium]